MHMERRHKRELTLWVHPDLKSRKEVKQMEPTEEIKKQQLEKGANQGRAGWRGSGWEGEMECRHQELQVKVTEEHRAGAWCGVQKAFGAHRGCCSGVSHKWSRWYFHLV